MFTFRKRKSTGLLALVLAGVAAFGAHAFTASSTVPDHSAGSGAAAVSGYTISNYAYTFSADGTTINVVAFDLDKAASDVKIALTATPSTRTGWTAPAPRAVATPSPARSARLSQQAR